MPGSDLPVIAIDAPWLYRRSGTPYLDEAGTPWPDNALRFALLGWVAAHIAAGELLPDWVPEVVHAHDWHAALAPVYMRLHPAIRAATVFTIHNLAFQGCFALDAAPGLELPPPLLTPDSLEFHGELSFMKGGLTHSDRITTVSPNYAREITRLEFGQGLDGLIRSRADVLDGILNGIDTTLWDPQTDPALAAHYDVDALDGKAINRRHLLREAGLPSKAPLDHEPGSRFVLAVVSRLSEQKGLDLLLAALPDLLSEGLTLVMLGSGDGWLERGFAELAREHPDHVSVRFSYDEDYAHRIFAGADAIIVPSRFEPCGLTQMYGLRYGTVPIVRRVGGLADTVIDEAEGTPDRPGTGFIIDHESPEALIEAVRRARQAYAQPARWQALMRAGMAQPLSWEGPARAYLDLYRAILSR